MEFVYSTPVELTKDEHVVHERVRDLLQGNSKPGQHSNDAFHLVESAKYGRHFITDDSRILKKKEEIWYMLHLKVVTPEELLQAYRRHAARNPR